MRRRLVAFCGEDVRHGELACFLTVRIQETRRRTLLKVTFNKDRLLLGSLSVFAGSFSNRPAAFVWHKPAEGAPEQADSSLAEKSFNGLRKNVSFSEFATPPFRPPQAVVRTGFTAAEPTWLPPGGRSRPGPSVGGSGRKPGTVSGRQGPECLRFKTTGKPSALLASISTRVGGVPVEGGQFSSN